MSKKETKALKTKKKQTGFDIMFRIVTALMAVAMFPVTYFLNLAYYALDWTKALKLLNNIKDILNSDGLLDGLKNFLSPAISGSTEQTQEITYDYISLSKLGELKSLMNTMGSDKMGFKDILANENLRPLVISLGLFALMLVVGLVIIVVSLIKAKPKVVAALSAVGSLLGVAAYIVFNVGFANPLTSGEKNLADVLNSGNIILQTFGTVAEIRYDNAFFISLGLMIAILVFSLSVIIVNSDDKEERALREAKKAKKRAKKAEKAAKKAEKKAEKAAEIIKEEKKKAESQKDGSAE